jgi:tRNA threonylcarbamoyladenosine biosynthesis protein TsaB
MHASDGMRLLALDTATDWCSVALWQDGQITSREASAERGHGGQLLTLIDELLADAGLALGGLDALAFGRGPGAFTGLRLAACVTQGLAFAAGLPVIPVSDLRALAQQLLVPPREDARVLICQDARMGEVYWAGFRGHTGHARADTPENVAAPGRMIEAARAWLGTGAAQGGGSGFGAYPELSALRPRLDSVHAEIHPRAREIAALAAADGLQVALPPEQALPVYVRDNVAVVPGTGVAHA